MSKYTVIASFHDQPPLDTPARIWDEAKQFDGNQRIEEIIEWIDEDKKYGQCVKIQIVK